MIWTVLPYVLVFATGVVVGLLVGRRNPDVANVVASAANQAKDAAQDAAKKV